MKQEEIQNFWKGQLKTVTAIGSFLEILTNFRGQILLDNYEEVENNEIRKIQPIVGEFQKNLTNIHKFLNENHYIAYYKSIGPVVNSISISLANQTMDNKKLDKLKFKDRLNGCINEIGEAMLAISRILPSTVDVNLRANNPFAAYVFIHSLLQTVSEQLIIIDPYIDRTIFFRYLYDINLDVNTVIITDSNKLKGTRLVEFEAIEELYKTSNPNYKRTMESNLHDRYIITETGAFCLGGSLKDAAKKSDYSIFQLTSEKRSELLQKYT